MKYRDGLKDCEALRKEHLDRIHKSMFDQQQRWKDTWKDIRDYINPYIGFFDEDTPNEGDRRDDMMINTMPIMANNTQAAGMQNGITSPTRPWVRLTVADPNLQELEEVRYWCDDVTQIMHDVLSRSNFYNSSHMFYKELGAPGTAAMMIIEDPKTVIRCRTFTVGEYAIANDRSGRVNRFARNLRLTVAELIEMFGLANCPPTVQHQFQSKDFDQHHKVKHLIIPNLAAEHGRVDKWNKPFISVYWMDECQDGDYLDIGGFEEFPVMCARWEVKGSDIYGRGPGWYALGDAKALQAIEEDIHIGVKKQVDPPVQAAAEILSSGGVNALPNGVTFYSRDLGDNPVRQLYQVQLDLADAKELKAEKEAAINKHFFVDLFRMLEGIDNGNITAREIIERVQEKMSLIGPVLDLLQSEFLKPVIDRIFGIMQRSGIIPEPPEVIQGMDIKVEYISIMAQAQKMTGLTALEQLMAFVGSMVSVDPNVLDKIDRDEMVDRYAEMLGVPPSVIISDDKVAQTRQAKAQQQQMAEAAQMGMMAAQGAKTLADTPVGQNSALDALVPGLGGWQQR